jgi:glucose 1-dehydrogenase
MLLDNKVAVVTGGARGLGYAIAETLATHGARVVIADVIDDVGEQAQSTLQAQGHDCRFVHCDVTQRDDVEHLMNWTHQNFGRIDSVVANAGIAGRFTNALELAEDEFDAVMAVNLKGVYLTGQCAARIMLKQEPDQQGSRGTIVNISSITAKLSHPSMAAYIMSKGGVNTWTRNLALTVADQGIRVNGIGPGTFESDLNTQMKDPEVKRSILSRTPMGRAGKPDEVGKVAAFLSSDLSSYLTGQIIYLDGGRTALNFTMPVHE